MDSAIVRHLEPELEPVAVVQSDVIPDNALFMVPTPREEAVQFREGRFRCILHLFAEASRRGKITGGSRETIVCSGARSALGLGTDLVQSKERIAPLRDLKRKGLSRTVPF
jgi:hypothetical protein